MKRKKLLISLCLLILGFGMIALGVLRGEHTAVWFKAVRICLECIGIG